jgi:hypothetical protein
VTTIAAAGAEVTITAAAEATEIAAALEGAFSDVDSAAAAAATIDEKLQHGDWSTVADASEFETARH